MTKRIYEKPVYIAQTYVTASSIAKCGAPVSEGPRAIWKGMDACSATGNDQGHVVGGQNGKQGVVGMDDIWNTYAGGTDSQGTTGAYLFDASNTTCDFVWSKGSDVAGWSKTEGQQDWTNDMSLRKYVVSFGSAFMSFFTGTGIGDDNKNHGPAWNGAAFYS